MSRLDDHVCDPDDKELENEIVPEIEGTFCEDCGEPIDDGEKYCDDCSCFDDSEEEYPDAEEGDIPE